MVLIMIFIFSLAVIVGVLFIYSFKTDKGRNTKFARKDDQKSEQYECDMSNKIFEFAAK